MNLDTHGQTARRSLWKTPAIVTTLLLLVPLLGNEFVDGWNWEPRGFVLFGSVIFIISFAYQLIGRNVDATAYRAAVGVALAAGFVLVWMNFVQAADDVNPMALWFFTVPVVGLVGAGIARFRPHGLVRAMLVTSIAQALVLTITLVIRATQGTIWRIDSLRAVGLNSFVLVLFVGSALLFRSAARDASASLASRP